MAGEELAAVGREGEGACRSWGACACPGGKMARGEWLKAVGVVVLLLLLPWLVVLLLLWLCWCRPLWLCSSSSSASSLSRGLRGSSV